MFEAKQIDGARGFKLLFRHLNCKVSAGEILYIKGQNGVGKTTLLKIFAGLVLPKNGSLHWRGVNIQKTPESFHSELLYVGDKHGLHDELSPEENLAFYMKMAKQINNHSLAGILKQLGLTKCKDLPVKYLSSGQKRRTSLGRLLIEQKRVWILDEPFNTLDTEGTKYISGLIEQHIEAKGLVMMTSHLPLTFSNQDMRTLELNECQFNG